MLGGSGCEAWWDCGEAAEAAEADGEAIGGMSS